MRIIINLFLLVYILFGNSFKPDPYYYQHRYGLTGEEYEAYKFYKIQEKKVKAIHQDDDEPKYIPIKREKKPIKLNRDDTTTNSIMNKDTEKIIKVDKSLLKDKQVSNHVIKNLNIEVKNVIIKADKIITTKGYKNKKKITKKTKKIKKTKRKKIKVRKKKKIYIKQTNIPSNLVKLNFKDKKLEISSKYLVLRKFNLNSQKKIVVDYLNSDAVFTTKYKKFKSKYYESITIGNHIYDKYFRVVIKTKYNLIKYKIVYKNKKIIILYKD